MNITKRKVTTIVVDNVYITADEWDNRGNGTKAWRDHMAKLLNARVKELAPKCDAMKFRNEMVRYANSIGFGCAEIIDALTLEIYGW